MENDVNLKKSKRPPICVREKRTIIVINRLKSHTTSKNAVLKKLVLLETKIQLMDERDYVMVIKWLNKNNKQFNSCSISIKIKQSTKWQSSLSCDISYNEKLPLKYYRNSVDEFNNLTVKSLDTPNHTVSFKISALPAGITLKPETVQMITKIQPTNAAASAEKLIKPTLQLAL
ncbi:hypothetical protein ABEB36_007470 [Hypothenemus hampei]|uniref:Uncharacterized protein n=1 Tax=Hypothenemus hampei TaxID=57062 RepID=A0ABD1EX58_HYPHA